MFDCVLPTRVARNGGLFTRRAGCASATHATPPTPARRTGVRLLRVPAFQPCQLRHLFMADEMLGPTW